MMNQKLVAARKEKGWSIEVASARVGVGRVTYSRWEHGHQQPQPDVLVLLCTAFERSAEELGYGHLARRLQAAESKERPISAVPQNALSLASGSPLIDITALLTLQETLMHDPEKRKTLQTLLFALSGAMIRPEGFFHSELVQQLLSTETGTVKANKETLHGYAKLIEACWQFSRGNELALAEKLLPESMAKVVPLAQQPSQHQQAAAKLATQGYQLYSVLALHRNDLPMKEVYCKQAIQYSLLSGDANLLVTSLRQLADTYRYANQYPQFLQTYLQTIQHVKEISPLLQSCMYRGTALAYAHVDQKQEALTYLGLAIDTFPDHPEADPSFSFAEFDSSYLILGEGMIRAKLGQTQQSLDVFQRIEQPNIIVPERIRVEIINQQAKTAIVSGDLEQGASYIEAGVTGARVLGSQRRYNEAYENFQQMRLLWPQERTVKQLAEVFSAAT